MEYGGDVDGEVVDVAEHCSMRRVVEEKVEVEMILMRVNRRVGVEWLGSKVHIRRFLTGAISNAGRGGGIVL